MSKKILKLALGAAAVGLAVKIGRDKYAKAKKDYEAEEVETQDDAIRKYTAFFDRKLVEVDSCVFEGCELKAFCSKLILDLSRAKFEKDVYVSFSANASRITIILPHNVRADADVTRKASDVSNYADETDKDLHTVYVIGDAVGSCIEIVPENVYLDDEEREEAEDMKEVFESQGAEA